MPQRWPAPLDLIAHDTASWADQVLAPQGWQPNQGSPAFLRSQWLLWQAWRLGRWNELEQGFRRPEFDPGARLVPCTSLGTVGLPPVPSPIPSPAQKARGWSFWLNAWPSPPNVWDAYRRALGTNDPQALGVDILWSRWFQHAQRRPAFLELLRRLEDAHTQGWRLADHPGLDDALTQGWQHVDAARDGQGRFAKMGRHFAELVERLQRWGVVWDEPGDDPDRTPRMWRLIQGQWMFLNPVEVEEDGWIGRLLINDPNLWDGPHGIRSFWAQAMDQEAPLLLPGEDLDHLTTTWEIVQRVAERSRLKNLAQGLTSIVRGRQRL